MQNYSSKYKILITGANGQLGYELQKILSDNELILTDVLDNSNLKNQKFYYLDITDFNQTYELANQTKPDWIIHAAAYTNVEAAEDNPKIAYAVNCDGSGNIAKVSNTLGAKLIAISTDYVFDGKDIPNGGYGEADTANPLSIYGKSKLAGEIAIMNAYPQAIILRTAWLYGGLSVAGLKSKNQNYPDIKNGIFKNFPNTILYNLFQGKELKIVNDQLGCPTYAGDLAQAIQKIIEKKVAQGIYHTVNSGQASWYDFAIAIAREAKINNYQMKIMSCKTKDFPTKAKRPKSTVLSIEKLTKAGITLPKWEQGVKSFLRLPR